jgi:hypothetical protein
MLVSMNRRSGIEAIAWLWRVLGKMKSLPSFAASCANLNSTRKPSGWER